jgi:hypothetical protein
MHAILNGIMLNFCKIYNNNNNNLNDFVCYLCVDTTAIHPITETRQEHKEKYIQYIKVKAVPLQAWSGPDGSRKLKFPVFLPTVQDDGKVVSPTHRPLLPPGNTPGTHFS